MIGDVYRGNCQFETLEHLKEAIWHVSDSIDLFIGRKLFKSIPGEAGIMKK